MRRPPTHLPTCSRRRATPRTKSTPPRSPPSGTQGPTPLRQRNPHASPRPTRDSDAGESTTGGCPAHNKSPILQSVPKTTSQPRRNHSKTHSQPLPNPPSTHQDTTWRYRITLFRPRPALVNTSQSYGCRYRTTLIRARLAHENTPFALVWTTKTPRFRPFALGWRSVGAQKHIAAP